MVPTWWPEAATSLWKIVSPQREVFRGFKKKYLKNKKIKNGGKQKILPFAHCSLLCYIGMECKQRETSCKRERDSLFSLFNFPSCKISPEKKKRSLGATTKKKPVHQIFELSWLFPPPRPSLPTPPQKKPPQRLIQSDLI